MTGTMAAGDDPSDRLAREDLRRFEGRLDARLQEIAARLVLDDGRFAALTDRLNQSNRRHDVIAARFDSRVRSIDNRLDALDTRLDAADARYLDVRDQLLDALRTNNAAMTRRTLLMLALSSAVTAAAGTLVIALTL